jgi:hypothetical protein
VVAVVAKVNLIWQNADKNPKTHAVQVRALRQAAAGRRVASAVEINNTLSKVGRALLPVAMLS